MSSVGRGQVSNLHDSSESNSSNSRNKRKRKQVNQEDNAVTHLLPHCDLIHHPDFSLQLSEKHIPVEIPANGDTPLDRIIALPDKMLPRHARPRIARENSGSSDASAANYFSGDSDLTAEPVMGCGADDEGAKSGNSGSSIPVRLPHATSSCADQAQTLAAAVCPPLASASLSPQDAENNHCDRKEATTTSTPVKWSHDTDFLHSKVLPTSQMAPRNCTTRAITGGCQNLQKSECADSGRDSESWLELRLGLTTELQQKHRHDLDAMADDQRAGREPSDNGITRLSPVTLQLLPDAYESTATCGATSADIRHTDMISVSHFQESSPPPVYNPAASSFSHIKPKLDDTVARKVSPDHLHQFLLNQRKDPLATALPPFDHQRYLPNPCTDPANGLDRSSSRSGPQGLYAAPGMVYDQAHGRCYADQYGNDDRRRWLADEAPDLFMVGAPPMVVAPRATEVYRPTPSLGWHPSTNAEAGSWSASSNPPSVQLQRSLSWQGLLRSMTADPLPQPFPEGRSLCSSFDIGVDVSGVPHGQHRHLLSAVGAAGRPPSSQMRTPVANHQRRLRLAPSRRNVGVWFSLQETRPFPDENGEDNDSEPWNNMPRVYLRIRDGKMRVSVLKSYLIKKLEFSRAPAHCCYTNPDEVDITCRGKLLAPNWTMEHVRDTIWLSKDMELNEDLGFRYTSSYSQDPQNRVMALCFQRQQVQSITLNLLKA